jgi:D-glycero-D-manno-heptose 1,7-bisphosphate phosphatase
MDGVNHRDEPVRQALVLVGGRGTRLGALTDETPKPMLDVAGRPFLEYQLDFLRLAGIEEIIFCSGYLAETLQCHFGDGERFGVRIRHSIEREPAGTGGAVKLAAAQLQELFFVLNGDTIFEADLPRLGAALRENPAAAGAVALREIAEVGRFGQVCLEGDRVAGFAEKSGTGRGLINGGVYCLRREAVQLLPTGPSSLERDLFPVLAQQHRLLGLPFTGYFLDIGLPETLAQARTELPAWFAEYTRRILP